MKAFLNSSMIAMIAFAIPAGTVFAQRASNYPSQENQPPKTVQQRVSGFFKGILPKKKPTTPPASAIRAVDRPTDSNQQRRQPPYQSGRQMGQSNQMQSQYGDRYSRQQNLPGNDNLSTGNSYQTRNFAPNNGADYLPRQNQYQRDMAQGNAEANHDQRVYQDQQAFQNRQRMSQNRGEQFSRGDGPSASEQQTRQANAQTARFAGDINIELEQTMVRLENAHARNYHVLSSILNEVPESARPRIKEAMTASQQAWKRARDERQNRLARSATPDSQQQTAPQINSNRGQQSNQQIDWEYVETERSPLASELQKQQYERYQQQQRDWEARQKNQSAKNSADGPMWTDNRPGMNRNEIDQRFPDYRHPPQSGGLPKVRTAGPARRQQPAQPSTIQQNNPAQPQRAETQADSIGLPDRPDSVRGSSRVKR